MALLNTSDEFLRMLEKNHTVLVLELDLPAAFDTFNHDVMMHILKRNMQWNDSSFDLVRSYLRNIRQIVLIEESRSDDRFFNTGVPHASILGPLLFYIYLGPLGEVLASKPHKYQIYADDMKIYKSLKKRTSRCRLNLAD